MDHPEEDDEFLGIIVHTVEGYKNSRGGRASLDHRTDIILIRAGLRPYVRRYVLWHEWLHYLINKRWGKSATAEVLHYLYDVSWSLFMPAYLLAMHLHGKTAQAH